MTLETSDAQAFGRGRVVTVEVGASLISVSTPTDECAEVIRWLLRLRPLCALAGHAGISNSIKAGHWICKRCGSEVKL